jgi:putative nucleotidyltransferase with HDIG domain
LKLRSRILRSKVARRIFLLFVACSLLPSVALSIVSSRFVTRQLETQNQRRLQREARSIGMEIVGRLALAESELRMIGATLLRQAEPAETLHEERLDQGLRKRFLGIAVIETSSSVKPLLGSIEIDPEMAQAARDHLVSGGVHLSTHVDGAGRSRIVLTKLVDDGPAAGSILAAEVDAAYLWGLTEEISLPAHTELVVLDPARNVMFDSLEAGEGELSDMLRSLDRSPTNDLTWNRQETEYIGRSWTMFLSARYGSPSWTVVVGMTHTEAFAPLVRFTRLLPQVSLLCLCIVILLSFVQVRRSLVPLESLRTGTERLARREFETRVRIDSGDEFEQLADSFNSMAGDLDRQFKSNAKLIGELERVNWETLHAFARAVDANSPWTAGHSERVTETALEIGRRLGLPEDELFVIHRGGLLHDVGKIGVPAHVLDKPGALTAEEEQLMRSHVSIGARILQPISAYAREIPLVLYHHERYDGNGYPEGLAGERIPFHARILAVADVFDALRSDRPYRAGWELERVLSYIREGSGTLFDPQVVAAFLEIVDREEREGVELCVASLS